MHKLILLFVASILLVSCERRLDSEQQKHIAASAALRQFVGDTQAHVLLDDPPTNAQIFVEWVQRYSLSTNKSAGEVRSIFDTVWVNTNLNKWIASGSADHKPSSEIAVVANHKIGATTYFFGITFEGYTVELNGMPSSDFLKLNEK